MDENRQQQSRQQQQQNKGKKKKNNGCLIAIIIFAVALFGIAFLGILAAVAIPGYMSYIKSSKEAEAKTNLKALANGVIAYQEGHEHFLEMPQGARLGPIVNESTIGIKSVPSAADMEQTPWKDLHFYLSTPGYYSYFYTTKSTLTGTVVQVTASASLSNPCDSIFYIIIDERGASPILKGDESMCNPLGTVVGY